VTSVQTRYQRATQSAREMVDEILAADADDQAWVDQLGPALSGASVARMLGVSPQAVSSNKGLLRLTMRSGRVGYPLFQFHGSRPVDGLAPIVRTLRPVVATEWTLASWLTSPNVELDGDTPIDVLRRRHRADAVTAAAKRFATALST
jgi:hypothetical protein